MTNPSFWKCPVHGPAKANAWGCPECVRELREEAAELKMTMRFQATYCSQCGGEFGPGDSGFSHCSDHQKHSEVVSCHQGQNCPCPDACHDNGGCLYPDGSDHKAPPMDAEEAARNRMVAEVADVIDRALDRLQGERDNLMQTLRDEMDENLRLRELGGARPDENITAMTERVIGERTVLARWIAEALLVLSTLDEDSEDGGESLRMLRDRGDRLVKAVLHG